MCSFAAVVMYVSARRQASLGRPPTNVCPFDGVERPAGARVGAVGRVVAAAVARAAGGAGARVAGGAIRGCGVEGADAGCGRVGAGVAFGVAVSAGVGVAVGVADAVAVGVGEGVAVAVGRGAGVAVADGRATGVARGDAVTAGEGDAPPGVGPRPPRSPALIEKPAAMRQTTPRANSTARREPPIIVASHAMAAAGPCQDPAFRLRR